MPEIVGDCLDIVNDDDFLDKIVDDLEKNHLVKKIPLNVILSTKDHFIEVEIKNKFLSNLLNDKSKLTTIQKQDAIREHEEWIHRGWGVFYNYEIDLDLKIFRESEAKAALEAEQKVAEEAEQKSEVAVNLDEQQVLETIKFEDLDL